MLEQYLGYGFTESLPMPIRITQVRRNPNVIGRNFSTRFGHEGDVIEAITKEGDRLDLHLVPYITSIAQDVEGGGFI